jgi:hypothetical protein
VSGFIAKEDFNHVDAEIAPVMHGYQQEDRQEEKEGFQEAPQEKEVELTRWK